MTVMATIRKLSDNWWENHVKWRSTGWNYAVNIRKQSESWTKDFTSKPDTVLLCNFSRFHNIFKDIHRNFRRKASVFRINLFKVCWKYFFSSYQNTQAYLFSIITTFVSIQHLLHWKVQNTIPKKWNYVWRCQIARDLHWNRTLKGFTRITFCRWK
jgi:hypothetical protein